ncbi:glycoside hydrolase family 31 protein [Klebsiella aerogenes]|nr:glycoside hydrolase family 31 protein [Klebsiella aerogenes]HBU8525049.1 glycoside hydrolase family 31 protein [Klebsiella aerogenes]
MRYIDSLKIENNRLKWHYNGMAMHIIPWGNDGLRVLAGYTEDIDHAPLSALLDVDSPQARFLESDTDVIIINGDISARIDIQGRLEFRNSAGKLLLKEMWRQRDNGEHFWAAGGGHPENISALKISGREFKPLSGNASRITVSFESEPDEHIAGMGQYQQPFLNLKGCSVELAQRNSQASVPFMMSSLGYGFLWNNPAIGEATFARNVTRWTSQAATCMDYWITAGSSPADILRNYARVTGTPPEMPDYGLGLWQSKLRYRTQDELLGVAREYHKRGIPLSVIVADFFHWPVQGDWKFDSREWPDPQAMTEELNAMGTKLMVSVWPTVDYRSENYAEMNEKGYLVNTLKGLNINFDFLGNSRFIDVTHPDARKFIWEKCRKNYFDQGVRLFWLDEAEPEYGVYDFDNFRYHIGNTLEKGNIYPLHYTQAFYEGLVAEGEANPVNLVRCAWAGSQRYGALVWSGDIHSSWDAMRNQLCAGLSMGLSGIAWWTTDIGGFHGGNVDDPAFHELLIRWFQWAVFSPVLRMHGHRDPITEPEIPFRDGIPQCNTGAGNELWSFGEKTCEILTHFSQLRQQLKPYLRELMRHAHLTGEPLMRPMFYHYSAQPQSWALEDQYLFGPDILVAPVMSAKQQNRRVWLPEGDTWIDMNTREALSGGRFISVPTPLNSIPVFIKKNSPVLEYLNLLF